MEGQLGRSGVIVSRIGLGNDAFAPTAALSEVARLHPLHRRRYSTASLAAASTS